MNSPIPLAAAFPAFSEDDWRSAVARTRGRGAGIPEDFRAPAPDALFPRRVGARPVAGRPAGAPCRIVQRATADEAAAVAAIISEDVAGGATGAEIVFAGSAHPLGGQLPVESATSIAASLAVGMPERFWLRVDTGSSAAAAEAFLDLAAARGAELVFTFDPIAALAARGPSATPAEIDTGLAALGRALEERGIDGAAVIADGRIWHAGGATEEQELGAAIATFVAHLRVLGKAERIGIALAADADQFRGIAKFRAMRLLLARVGEVAGLTASPRVHAETAWRMMSRRDSEMNILRTTSATFAAAVGGADSISVLPFDAVDGDDAHARRLARNTQTILAEESHLFRVADPRRRLGRDRDPDGGLRRSGMETVPGDRGGRRHRRGDRRRLAAARGCGGARGAHRAGIGAGSHDGRRQRVHARWRHAGGNQDEARAGWANHVAAFPAAVRDVRGRRRMTARSGIPDFAHVPWRAPGARAAAETAKPWQTAEGIAVKPVYGEADVAGLDFINGWPGLAPYLRGPYPAMYLDQPWTIRQYAGFSTAEESKRVLPAQSCRRAERAVGRLRPAHPSRLRFR